MVNIHCEQKYILLLSKMFWLLILLFVVLFLYQKFMSGYLHWNKLGVKCWKPMIFFGDFWLNSTGREAYGDLLKRQYNAFKNERFYGGYQMTTPGLYIKDPELLRQIAIKDFDHFTDHIRLFFEKSLWSKTLINLQGEEWRQMRYILSPTFTSSKIKTMFGLMYECADKMAAYFSRNSSEIQEIEFKDVFTRYANDVIATCAFGVKCDSLSQRDNDFYNNGKDVTNMKGLPKALKRACTNLFPILWNVPFFRLQPDCIFDFFKSLILETINTREANNIVRNDMLQLLIDLKNGCLAHDDKQTSQDTGFSTVNEHITSTNRTKNKKFTLEQLQAQAYIFFFGGFDTVSSFLSFTGYEIGINVDVQNKLRCEIDATLNMCDGKLTYETMNKMKYLDMVVSESLRKWPPAAVLDRLCTIPYKLPTKENEPSVWINKGDHIFVPVIGIHNDPDLFPEPQKFDPERFSDENKEQIKPYTYMPFGIGPRNCIASRFALVEVKVALVCLISKFELIPISKTQIPLKLHKTSRNITAEKGFWMGIKLRTA